MFDPIPLNDEGDIDHEQAAVLATELLDPDLTERCRELGVALDEIYVRSLAISRQLSAALEELARRDEDGTLFRGHAILHGVDTSMTYPTLVRAQKLLRSWSGEVALAARCYRVTNVLNAAIGLEEALVDEERIGRDLAEERGR